MFDKILIANRGEIACRILRTCSRLGVRTVAVYSDADREALHVALADEAVHVGESAPRQSYLNGEVILRAARERGAQAIHPGYGFLSENPDFAETCERAGIVFIGPESSTIRSMALKDAAKRLAAAAGVPVLGGHEAGADDQALSKIAIATGFPVLIKAIAGGGGRGMRRVENAADFQSALDGARREAMTAFGNAAMLVEKYITCPRHIEVQVFADAHGSVVHLFERDCSIQRRHQKVLEESPAPGLPDAMRRTLTDAAIAITRNIDYRGAGTIEFIADVSDGLRADRFWFMEMNTRLQVEHPVTEMVTGVDLVEWQLRVAAGEPLPLRQDQIRLAGHAVEARVCAENPRKRYFPSPGTIDDIAFPQASARIDTGVVAGDRVTPFYDSLLAKIIVHRPGRLAAIDALSDALVQTRIAGIATNLDLLDAVCRHPAFRGGDVSTAFLADFEAELLPHERPAPAPLDQGS